MSWEPLKCSLGEFDEIVANLGVQIGDGAPPSAQLRTIRQFLDDRESTQENGLLSIWNILKFKVFYDAAK